MIIGTLLVRNESDIIEECLKHHLNQGIDYYIITNHKSDDNTREICSYFKEVIQIIDKNEKEYLHGKWMTEMARIAFEKKADWVIPIDGDEFWFELNTLKKINNNISKVWIKYFYHHPPTKKIKEKFSTSQMPYYYQVPDFYLGNQYRLAFRPNEKTVVTDGNHQAYNVKGEETTSDDIYIHHYPARSLQQFKKKINLGVESLKNSNKNLAIHWKKWYNKGIEKSYKDLLINEKKTIKIL